MPVIKKLNDAETTTYDDDQIKGMKKHLLIGAKENSPTMALRIMEVEESGYSPYHSHSWEHVNYILEGEGILVTQQQEYPLQPGDSVLVEPELKHQYRNTGKGKFKFICMVPVANQ
ncbi:MAG: hypothetical protein APR63_11300 [Desulfuromonas sp. SDB]|nr:MAG: hypothetical protein APR63_11300 [Desulfuromonas sp. SDB]